MSLVYNTQSMQESFLFACLPTLQIFKAEFICHKRDFYSNWTIFTTNASNTVQNNEFLPAKEKTLSCLKGLRWKDVHVFPHGRRKILRGSCNKNCAYPSFSLLKCESCLGGSMHVCYFWNGNLATWLDKYFIGKALECTKSNLEHHTHHWLYVEVN